MVSNRLACIVTAVSAKGKVRMLHGYTPCFNRPVMQFKAGQRAYVIHWDSTGRNAMVYPDNSTVHPKYNLPAMKVVRIQNLDEGLQFYLNKALAIEHRA